MPDFDSPSDSRSAGPSDRTPTATDETIDTAELLSLLGDEYTREVLATLGDESLPARTVAERSDVSRPTVYRRLNRLEAVGAVETVMTIHPDGQHRQEFRVVVDEVTVSLTSESLAADAATESARGEDSTPRPAAQAPR